ncbi:hypothetical protein DFJ73DRAFT_579630 [Zopfochytrium polystomum]|nr:hypothetical protein DFJ73DRAFT_579630 [Zopfochytrium polystomum]
MKSETLWQDDAGRAAEVQRAAARLEERINAYDVLKAELEEGLVMIDMAREESDLDLAREVTRDMTGVAERLEQESFKMMMSEPTDKNGCFIELRAGAGGLEACDWTATLARMYERWAADHSHDVGIVDEGKGDVGYKHITLEISGEHAYGWCKYETGVHRFVRLSKFGEAKRQTAFVSVHVYPQLDEEIISENEIAISKHDIRIDVMRAQGAGGQHVNKTESAVRIVHIPTGITVTCQKTRSQIKNRETAMQMLRSRLYQQQLASQAAQKAESYASLPEHSWGSQIRSYVMMPYQLVKDLRSGYERTDVQNVLDGELDKIMEANLLHFKRQKA